MLNRFGRGGSLSFKTKSFTTKGLYVNDSSSIPASVLAGDISYLPLSTLSFSLSSMQGIGNQNKFFNTFSL